MTCGPAGKRHRQRRRAAIRPVDNDAGSDRPRAHHQLAFARHRTRRGTRPVPSDHHGLEQHEQDDGRGPPRQSERSGGCRRRRFGNWLRLNPIEGGVPGEAFERRGIRRRGDHGPRGRLGRRRRLPGESAVRFHPLLQRASAGHVATIARQHLLEGDLRGLRRIEALPLNLQRAAKPAREHARQRVIFVAVPLAGRGDERGKRVGELVGGETASVQHRQRDHAERGGVTARRADDGLVRGRRGHAIAAPRFAPRQHQDDRWPARTRHRR